MIEADCTLEDVSPEMTSDSGQAAFVLVLMLGTFLLAIFGFSVDLTNIWFHRQAATAASDAACQAGAMDLLASAGGLVLSGTGFTAGNAGDCISASAATMCSYAKLNGYDGAGLNSSQASNAVSWIFPQSVPGVTPGVGSHPFLKVSITENVQTYFIALVTASHVQPITVSTTCGLTLMKGAAPMVVLHPNMSGAFYYSGGGALDIVGGPSRGLQVNSTSDTAIQWLASGMIDLSMGGPSQTGSDVAVVGGPTTGPTNGTSSGFLGGSTGSWRGNALPVSDPFSAVVAPASIHSLTPASTESGTWVAYGTDGCPDHSGGTGNTAHACKEFSPGYYPGGINLPSVMNRYSTAIFAPGIYYMNGSLTASNSDTVRMAKPAGYQQTDGVMFYFFTGSLAISGCSGCSNSGVDNVAASDLTCDGLAPPAALNMPASLYGNVLWGQCTANGSYWDSGNDTPDKRGVPGSRGLLIFQDHGNTSTPSLTGSGALSFAGALYFHSTSYADVLSLSGGSTSGTFILGEIIADQVSLTGSGVIKLALNPAASMDVSKVAIFE
jgi:hypothetical protein